MLLLTLDQAGEASDEYLQLAALAEVPTRLCALAGGAPGGEVPPLTTALQAAAQDAPRVVVLRLGVVAAPEAEAEIAAALRWVRGRHPSLGAIAAQPLLPPRQLTTRLAGITRALQAAAARTDPGPQQTALLLVAPRGGEPEGDAEVARLARSLWDPAHWATVEIAFLDGATPDIAEGLERCRCLGAARVIALPLVLLNGPTYERMEAQILADADAQPDLELIVGPELGEVEELAAVAAARHRAATQQLARIAAHGHDHGAIFDPGAASGLDALLPPRYQGDAAVSAAPMGAADLAYDAEGRVAWDTIWEDFCDLALAGGPPHRGDLLLPPDPSEVRARPEEQARVLDELARGLALITGWPVVRDAAPGWIGLACPDAEAAIWLLRAIIVENVAVRREATTLLLPAGPDFRLDREIRNVITVVAKTHHYWTEHIRG